MFLKKKSIFLKYTKKLIYYSIQYYYKRKSIHQNRSNVDFRVELAFHFSVQATDSMLVVGKPNKVST